MGVTSETALSLKDEPVALCQLCQNDLSSFSVRDEEGWFCCAGCQAVYHILKARNELNSYASSSTFKQALKFGLITNPLLHHEKSKEIASSQHLKRIHFEIEHLWCPSCAIMIELLLKKFRGVIEAAVDYATDLAYVEYNRTLIDEEKIFQTISSFGYGPKKIEDLHQKNENRSLWIRFVVSAFFTLNTMMFSYPIYATYFDKDLIGYDYIFAWVCFLLTLPVMLYSAQPIFRRVHNAFLVSYFGMEVLVGIGVFSALAISVTELFQGRSHVYFDTANVIISFVLLGKIIESKSKFSAKNALFFLTKSLPRRGRKRFKKGDERFVAIKEIAIGDQVVIHTGERIILDGVVLDGEGTCDESMLTGESMPILKKKGEHLLAGTILQQGSLTYQVTSLIDKTILHQVIETIGKDIKDKEKIVIVTDEIVKWFVPIVTKIAIVTVLCCLYFSDEQSGLSLFENAIQRGMAVLLISCPCAIGIAAPLVESAIIVKMTSMGAILRNRRCLQFLGKEKVFVFDKTGTITKGKFRLISGLENLSEDIKIILKSLAVRSNHPICQVISHEIHVLPIDLEEVIEIPGKGIKAIDRSQSYLFGSRVFLQEEGIKVPNAHRDYTEAFFVEGGVVKTQLIFGDELKEEAVDLIQSLWPSYRVLLSGDHDQVVEKVAQNCGFDRWIGNKTPLQKKEEVSKLQKEIGIVAMVGDGINDAPALCSANLGFSFANATEMSIQVSDIILTHNNLQMIPSLRKLGIFSRKILKQNLFWAFFYNVIGIGLAISGLLTPLFSALAMVISSLIVLWNANRLHRFDKYTRPH